MLYLSDILTFSEIGIYIFLILFSLLYLCKTIRFQTFMRFEVKCDKPLYLCKTIRFQTKDIDDGNQHKPLYLCKTIRFQTLKLQSPHGIPASSASYLILMQPLPVFPCSIYPLREGRQHAPLLYNCDFSQFLYVNYSIITSL